ncbi:radical SAM family heme chaperone HemW [Segatella salivae]|uniref:radical SAM family heme chaperone HemW n=1 Tax=Segatella salivae TaxID=228604 RepID=UPI0028EA79FB|nr:radical SAM family heme chaperone HemW [Segatella salivae]
MAGLYIHIPFCASRCIYCGFYSTTQQSLQQKYVDMLCHEIDLRASELLNLNTDSDNKLHTIYLGGGTPSMLSSEQLNQLLTYIYKVWGSLSDLKELTIECNPDDITEEFAVQLADLKFNRVSMGAQTFSNERLKFLHRRHNREDIFQAVTRLRHAGIQNISIDLMFGFPNETIVDWQRDIREAIDLGVEHISAYSLMYEEGTSLFNMREHQKIKEVDEETSLSMYNILINELTNADYEQYEISNFARPGFRSLHNSSYWHEIPYIGLGASAHSYLDGIRKWNISNLKKYMDEIACNTLPQEIEILSKDTQYNDLITTALRTKEGIDLNKMKNKYGEERYNYLMKEAQPHINAGKMKLSKHHLFITRMGLFTSDDIMSDLIYIAD